MPVSMKRAGGSLAVTIKGVPDFKEVLDKVKSIPGRRWNANGKVWELPDDPNTLIQAVEILRPELSAELRSELGQAQGEIADDLVTRAGSDADLVVPWASELWAFQRAGVAFGVEHPCYINADDMGLGKTLQSITTVEEYWTRQAFEKDPDRPDAPWTYRTGPVLVVCPNTLKDNWKKEIEHGPNPEYFDTSLWPKLQATIIDAPKGKRGEQLKSAAAANHYVIVNWEKLRLLPEAANVKWAAVIADEAHRAKNRDSTQSKALRKIHAPLKIAATGTPIMNSPDELWPLLNWFDRKTYGAYWRFFNMYVESYPGYKQKPVITGVRNPDALRHELADKLIRRTKTQVLDDFPDKLPEEIIEVEMLPKQKKAYQAAQNDFWLDIEAAMADADEEKARSIVQALQAGDPLAIGREVHHAAARLSFMRQISTSPALLDGEDVSSKLDACVETITDHPGKPFVVACWHKAAAELMAARLERRKPPVDCRVLHGDVPQQDRQKIVDDFQNGEFDVLISTIAVGGVGITLTRSDTILFIEEDWVPANNRQMEDRLYRIGQKNDVSVVKYRTKDTVDTNDIAPANRLKELIELAVYGEEK